jgi:hypothetical protein
MVTPPHWPQPGLGQPRIGLGSAPIVMGYAAAAGLPTTPEALLALMPTSVQASIQAGVSIYGDLGPTISLAQTVSGGGAPSEQAVIGGLAAAASCINPIAGAALAAAGEAILGGEALMQSLFDAWGLYSHPRLVQCCGLRVAGSIPYPPDPKGVRPPDWTWVQYQTPSDLIHGHIFGLKPGEVCAADPTGNGSLMFSWLLWALTILVPQDPYVVGVNAQSAASGHNPPIPTNPFDVYFAHLLRADLEAWANCNAFIPPRQLLMAAQLAWNQTHSSSSTIVYSPVDYADWYENTRNVPTSYSLVSTILGNSGDPVNHSQRVPPITVNLGPIAAPPGMAPPPPGVPPTSPKRIALHIPKVLLDRATSPTPSPPLSTGTMAVAGGAAIGGAAILGVVAFSLVEGVAVDAVVGHAWKHVKGWFR